MTASPLVTAIIPCRNHAAYVPQRLASVLGQTMSRLEVLFLDDDSADGSFEAAAAFAADPRLTLRRLEPPAGNPFAAWRAGLSLVRTPLTWIAESDDASEPDFLETLLPAFAADPRLGMAYCQSWAVDGAGRITGSLADHTRDIDDLRWRADFAGPGPEECRRALVLRNTIPNASACLFRTDALRPALAAASGYAVCGDWAAYASLLAAGWNIAFRAAPKNYFRRHPGSQQARLAQGGHELLETARLQRALLAAVDVDDETVAAASTMTLDRLAGLAGSAGAERASSWFADGTLLDDLLGFDPHFLAGLAGSSAGRRFWCDVYAEDGGRFHEGCKVTLAYAPNRPARLSLTCPAGSVRLDPTRAPGLLRLHEVVLSAEDGRILANYTGKALSRLRPGGTAVVLSADETGLLLWSSGNDPWLVVSAPPGMAGGRMRLEVQLTGYSLTPGSAPLPDFWPSSGS